LSWPAATHAAPASDDCGSPTVIASLPFSDTLDTTAATTGGGDPALCGAVGQGTHSVWYSLTPAAAGTVYAETFASDYDTVLAIFTGGCTTPTPIACSDDFADAHTSYASFPVQAGVAVLIEVAGSQGAGMSHNDSGSLHFTIDLLPDKTTGKNLNSCQKTLAKGGAGLVSRALKGFDKCARGMFKCLELEDGDPSCLDEQCRDCHPDLPTACQQCHSTFSTSKDPFAKLVASAVGACDEPKVSFEQMMETSGLGYDLHETECRNLLSGGSEPIVGVPDVGMCTALQHGCEVAKLFATQLPRTRELLSICGSIPDELECLPDNGAGGTLTDLATAKVVLKCQAAIVKAGAKLAATTLKSLEQCVGLAYTCLQTKGADLKCINGNKAVTNKAGGADFKCDKQYAKIAAAQAKFTLAIDKACGAIPFATLKSTDAANIVALAAECAALGVPALDTLADYEKCLERRHVCFAEDVLRFEVPRGEGLLPIVSPMPALDDSFCPSPFSNP
jgi:hypothetical protein